MKKNKKKTVTVRSHTRKVPVSEKNPMGVTVVDSYKRRAPGTYLKLGEINKVFKQYGRKDIKYPTPKKLSKYKNSDKYDDHIAVWVDYFNKKFNAKPLLDPDVVKALLASESS